MTPALRSWPTAEPHDNLVRRSFASSKQPIPSRSTARELAQNTPASRDRAVDFLRATSILVVMFGHWLMASVTVRHGKFTAANTLEAVPMLQRLTWILQVIPVFFFVGGFSNSVTLSAFWRDGRTGSAFIVSRAQRLLKPVFVLLAVWIPLAFILTNIGMSRQLLGPATKLVAQPLWFIAVYFLVTALAPAMRTLHDRHRTHVPVVLAVGAIAIDALRFGFGTESFGYANLLFVWLFAQQLGFFYADGSLIRVRPTVLITTAALAFAMLIALTTFGPYPVSMVGLPGDKVSNMNPPTLCLLVLTIMQVALVLLARPALTRWLRRERSWTRIVALNGVIMTVFLWHLSAMLVVLTVLNHFNIAQPMAGTAMWWLTRPVWFAALIGALLPLVATFGKLERPTPNNAGTATPKRALTALGVFGVVVGIGGIAATDLVQLSTPGRAHVVILTMSTLQSIVLALLGAALLRPPRRSTPTV